LLPTFLLMQLILRKLIFILFLFVIVDGISQIISPRDRQVIDSLKELDYKDIYNSFKRVEDDSSRAFVFAQAYLEKGKIDNDSIKIANAFSQLNFITNNSLTSIKYGDSIIHYTKNMNHKDYPSLGYLIKAGEYYYLGNYKLALDNYIITNKYLEKNENIQQLLAVKTEIAGIKDILGLHQEVFSEYKDIMKLVIKDSLSEYYNNNFLTALLNLASSYNSVRKLDSADILIKEGIYKSLKLKDTAKYYSFISLGGFNAYFKGNYQAAGDSLDKSFPFQTDQNSRINYYLYKGKIAKDLNKAEEAILNFEKLDSIYEIHQDPVRELPEVYQTFIDYYKEKGDIQNQLKYIDKFIAVDSVLDANFNYLNTKITKEYDIPLLIEDKENLINQLKGEKRQTNLGIGILVGMTLLLGWFLFYYIKKQKFYKKRFEEILNSKPNDKSQTSNSKFQGSNSKPPSSKLEGVSKEVIDSIQRGLQGFEKEKIFLDPTITLNSLSKKLDTNSNYLSKVINFYQQKNFSTYLNDLRIEYAIEQLKTNAQFRRYSVKGMAQEVGFNSVESFSKAFYKRTGIYPSYFLKELEKIKELMD